MSTANHPRERARLHHLRIVLLGWSVLWFGAAQAQYPPDSCGIPERIWPAGFEADDMPAANLPAQSTALTLAIDSSLIGASTDSERIAVFGAFAGPPNTGVSDGAMPALTDGGRFLLPAADLSLGPNTFIITATTIDGATVSRSLTITRTAPSQLRPRFLVDDASVFAPGFARFRFVVPNGLGVTALSIDFDGDGTTDTQGLTALDGVRARYAIPGFYPARATVSWDDGDPVTPIETAELSAPLLMRHTDLQRLTLCDTWFGMSARLVTSDLPGAALRLVPAFRDEATAVWTELGQDLPSVVGQLGLVVDGSVGAAVSELLIARPRADAGSWDGFPVQFELGRDGVWRISRM